MLLDRVDIQSGVTGSSHETLGSLVGMAQGATGGTLRRNKRWVQRAAGGSNCISAPWAAWWAIGATPAPLWTATTRCTAATWQKTRCHGGYHVGGLAGRNCNGTGTLSNSYASAVVKNEVTTGCKYTAADRRLQFTSSALINCYYDSSKTQAWRPRRAKGQKRSRSCRALR